MATSTTLVLQLGDTVPDTGTVVDTVLVDSTGKPIDIGGASAPDLTDYAKKTDVPAAYKLPAASASAIGGVKQGAAVADAAAAPTMEEYNALLKSLRDAGIIKA